jgi:hypothetical protein
MSNQHMCFFHSAEPAVPPFFTVVFFFKKIKKKITGNLTNVELTCVCYFKLEKKKYQQRACKGRGTP